MSAVTTESSVDVGQLRERVEQAHRQVEALREQFSAAQRAAQLWEALAADVEGQRCAAALLVLRRKARVLCQPGSGASTPSFLETLRAMLEARARASAASFERTFPEAIVRAGLALDPAARHPRYTLRDGFLRVDVDERDLTATVTPRDGATILLGLDVEPLVETLRREDDRLFGRTLEPERLLRQVYDAYLALLEADGGQEGQDVPLRRLLKRLSADGRRVAADEFNVDLARLAKSSRPVIDGRRLHLNHTRNVRQGMLLSGLERGGYAGFISFPLEAPP